MLLGEVNQVEGTERIEEGEKKNQTMHHFKII